MICSSVLAQSDTDYLPVRLANFDASANTNIAKLHWSTICYLDFANFQIQKSVDGINFTTVNTFTADKFRCTQPFDFADSSLTHLGTVFYRINVGNIDGKFFYSAIRSVYLKEKSFKLTSVYPTLVSATLHFSLANDRNENFRAVIVNGAGKVVKSREFQAVNGITKYTMPTADLSHGYYWLRVLDGRGNADIGKFLKQN